MRQFKSQPRKFKEGRVPIFDIHELSSTPTFNKGVPLQVTIEAKCQKHPQNVDLCGMEMQKIYKRTKETTIS